MIERAISLVAPHKCISCGRIGEVLCEACVYSDLPMPPSRCYSCHTATSRHEVCDKCSKNTKLSHVWVATYYQDLAKEILHKFKFERVKSASTPISLALHQVLHDLPKDTVITHIPTANSRVRIRGYDQSKLLAKNLAKLGGFEHKTLLMRKGSSRQLGSSRAQRQEQIKTSLIPINTKEIDGSNILIIDDVTTTGASIEEAANILKSAGAKNLDALVFAQAID